MAILFAGAVLALTGLALSALVIVRGAREVEAEETEWSKFRGVGVAPTYREPPPLSTVGLVLALKRAQSVTGAAATAKNESNT